MTSPAGFLVTTPTKQRMLILTQASAVDRAALHHGTVEPLFTVGQIVRAMEDACCEGSAIDALIELGLGELA